MKYDFHDVKTLAKVREAISELLLKLYSAKSRLNNASIKDIDTIFNQFHSEFVAYRRGPQYELLRAYELCCARERYFAPFDREFFLLLRETNRTVSEFINIISAIDTVISRLYFEAEYISENYL